MSGKFDQKKFREELRMLGKNYRMGGASPKAHNSVRSRSRKSRKSSEIERPVRSIFDVSDVSIVTPDDSINLGHSYRLSESADSPRSQDESMHLGASYRIHSSSESDVGSADEASQSFGRNYRSPQKSQSPAPRKSSRKSSRKPAVKKRLNFDDSEDEVEPILLGRNYRNVQTGGSGRAARLGRRYRMGDEE